LRSRAWRRGYFSGYGWRIDHLARDVELDGDLGPKALAFLWIVAAAEHVQHGAVVGADVGCQGADAVPTGLLEDDFDKFAAHAFFLKGVDDGDGHFGRGFARADVAGAGNGGTGAARQIGVGNDPHAADVGVFGQ